MPEFLPQDTAAERARDEANAWVARFAPLVLQTDAPTVPELRERLQLLEGLRAEGPVIRTRLRLEGDAEDATLRETLEKAIHQLDSIESDLRKQLGRLAPGDTEGIADLEAINDRLTERMARQEVGLRTDVPEILQMRTSPANLGAAVFMGIFGLGWTSFTTFHAFFMIGGMMRSFGFVALFLLAFYAIFFVVGFGMLAAAVTAASVETIELQGNSLLVRHTLGFWTREKRHELDPRCPAEIEMVSSSNSGRRSLPSRVVVVHDLGGNAIQLASGATESRREDVRDRINAYLAAQP